MAFDFSKVSPELYSMLQMVINVEQLCSIAQPIAGSAETLHFLEAASRFKSFLNSVISESVSQE